MKPGFHRGDSRIRVVQTPRNKHSHNKKKKHLDPFSKQWFWQLFTYDSENGEMTKRSIFIGLVQVAGSEVFDKKCRFAGEKNYNTKEIERDLFEVTK